MRDLRTPLAPSTFDTGGSSFKEAKKKQKQENKLQNLKSKGESQSKNIAAGKKKSGATKGGGMQKMVSAVSTGIGLATGVMGLVKGAKK